MKPAPPGPNRSPGSLDLDYAAQVLSKRLARTTVTPNQETALCFRLAVDALIHLETLRRKGFTSATPLLPTEVSYSKEHHPA